MSPLGDLITQRIGDDYLSSTNYMFIQGTSPKDWELVFLLKFKPFHYSRVL
jgi:hypothetical protein